MRAPQRAEPAYRAAAAIVRPVLLAITAPDWQGLEHLPVSGGFIAAANHVSNLDPLTLAHLLWDTGHPARFMAKRSLWDVPVLGAVMRRSQMVPVDRQSTAAAGSVAAAAAVLAAGECVAVFPEGTLTKDPDGWPMRARTGVARLAFASGAPVVPVAQWGARQAAHRVTHGRLLPRTPVRISVGAPVDLADLADRRGEAAVLRQATDRIMAAVTAQLAELRGEQPPDGVWDRAAGARVVR